MIRTSATVDIWATDGSTPTWDGNALRISDGPLSVTLHVDSEVGAEWCVKAASLLLGKAEELGIDRRQSQRDIASLTAYIADIRREKGEIADDGWCWNCKAGDHEGHRPYNEGRCHGCSCDFEVAR